MEEKEQNGQMEFWISRTQGAFDGRRDSGADTHYPPLGNGRCQVPRGLATGGIHFSPLKNIEMERDEDEVRYPHLI